MGTCNKKVILKQGQSKVGGGECVYQCAHSHLNRSHGQEEAAILWDQYSYKLRKWQKPSVIARLQLFSFVEIQFPCIAKLRHPSDFLLNCCVIKHNRAIENIKPSYCFRFKKQSKCAISILSSDSLITRWNNLIWDTRSEWDLIKSNVVSDHLIIWFGKDGVKGVTGLNLSLIHENCNDETCIDCWKSDEIPRATGQWANASPAGGRTMNGYSR